MDPSHSSITSSLIDRERLYHLIKIAVIFLGGLSVLFALAAFPTDAFHWGYLLLVLSSIFVAPRMSLTLPRSKFALSFADVLIFLTFLLYGGSAAILLSAVEMLSLCLYLRSRGFPFGRLMIPVNIGINAASTTGTFLVWLAIPSITGISLASTQTRELIVILGILALAQFAISSVLAAIVHSFKDWSSLWDTWKKDCFTSSMTQMVGAGIAGLIFKLVNYGDLLTFVIAFVALGIAYLNYRQSIEEINEGIEKVEEAERQRANTEMQRRIEAESYAGELARSLENEAQANVALRKSEKDLQYAALHDALTGLPNRKYLIDLLSDLLLDYKNTPTKGFQVLFIDIRKFKDINDTLGHTIGDKVLVIAAKRFVRMLNSDDIVARIGGDEFAIVLRDVTAVNKSQKIARRIYQNITQPFSLGGQTISVDINIGIAPCDVEHETPGDILRDADIAMHFAKERSEGPAVFNKEIRDRFMERVRFETDLKYAIDREELSMHYQPIVDLAAGRLIGFEALLRWHHSELGLIPPARFIPIAEYSGLIIPLTVWILEQTTRQISRWQKISPEYADLMVSVNISGRHLTNENLLDDVESVLRSSDIIPSTLKLEITESTAMENAENTINILQKLKKLGVQLSIDDFGTGYSSLSYLHRLPFDTLKIDRSFVNNVGANGENAGILQTIITLGTNLSMRVIAEGIETQNQLRILQRLGCNYGQGYLLARPKNAVETESLLNDFPEWLPSKLSIPYSAGQNAQDDANLPVF